MKLICKECGKEFEGRTKRQEYCKGPHVSVCAVCGRRFEYTCSPKFKPATCSKECKYEFMKRRNIEKYGVENVSQIPEVRRKKSIVNSGEAAKAKSMQTCMERYGHPYAMQSPEMKKKLSDKLKSPEVRKKTAETFMKHRGYKHLFADPTFREEHGCNTVSYNPEIREKAKETIQARYGVEYVSQIPEAKERAKETRKRTMLEKYEVATLFSTQYSKDMILEDYGVDNVGKSTHARVAVGEAKSRFYAEDGNPVDSSYERDVYNFCLRNNIPFEYQAVSIPYEYQGKQHVTIIDFLIDGILVECKGGHLLNGLFDPGLEVPMHVKLDVYRKHAVVVVTDSEGSRVIGKKNSSESNGFKYRDKCPNPLIGVDISLFTNNLEFPYRADRPPCFYDVRVDGQKSIHEAFFDGQLRWKMIKNRIEYSGGFIDAKQVLTAFNVTRTCKQPSWFSKSLAKDLISKYCTSDVIVDPFAGYGARADAAHELNREYIGIDFNKSLVDWHHEHGRDCISWGDANEFKYDGDCSVFICPPYSDPETGRCFEDYNFEGFDDAAKAKSQCDWLKIVMKNVPNAGEYVMVCKIVDSGWEQFIVGTKNNRSHFGSNNEYVIRVSREARDKALGA